MKIQFGDKVKIKGDTRMFVVVAKDEKGVYRIIPENTGILQTILGEVVSHQCCNTEDIIAVAVEEKRKEEKNEDTIWR